MLKVVACIVRGFSFSELYIKLSKTTIQSYKIAVVFEHAQKFLQFEYNIKISDILADKRPYKREKFKL